ncbi:MAG TPA: PKD domain-containing protein [Chryseolinea sp.]
MKSKIYAYLTLFLMFACVLSCKDEDAPAPQAAATFTADKTTAQVDETIQFTNTSQNATAFKWSFGDGTTSKEVSPKKSFQSSGTFLVSLVSTGEGGSTISNLTVTVVPSAAFTVAGEDNLTAFTPIQFTNLSKGATSYLWSFGNEANSTSTSETPTFAYIKAGKFTVTLKAISAQGETTFSKELTIKPVSPELYFIEEDDKKIKKLAIDGSGTVTDFVDITGKVGVGLAYDDVHGKIYFSDSEGGKIWRVNIDGTEMGEIAGGFVDPQGIALDVPNGKIYWADDWDDNSDTHIYRANLDGTEQETIVTMNDAQFRAVAVDTEHQKLYFYEVNYEAVYMSDLDGSNPTSIIDGPYGYSIVVDNKHDKIYFGDRDADEVKSADLDGSNVQTIVPFASRTYGMVYDEATDKLYVSGSSNGEIFVTNLDGTEVTTLKTSAGTPYGMFLRK